MEKNKVKFKLKRAYYAQITEDQEGVITYGTPVRIPGSVAISLSPEGEMNNFRADATVYHRVNQSEGYAGNLEVALIPDDFRVYALGETLDETNQIIYEKSTDQNQPFALLFEFEADKKNVRHVLYYCYASRSSIEGENPDKREVKSETISITAIPREIDNLVKSKTNPNTPSEVYDSWYSKVHEPEEVEPVKNPEDGADD